jgi:hypothetical protein
MYSTRALGGSVVCGQTEVWIIRKLTPAERPILCPDSRSSRPGGAKDRNTWR